MVKLHKALSNGQFNETCQQHRKDSVSRWNTIVSELNNIHIGRTTQTVENDRAAEEGQSKLIMMP